MRHALTPYALLLPLALLALFMQPQRVVYGQDTTDTGSTTFTPGTGAILLDITGPEGHEDAAIEWTLIRPENKRLTSGERNYELPRTKAGHYTLTVDPPLGSTAEVTLLRNGQLDKQLSRPQINFDLNDGESVSITMDLTFTLIGKVSVTSSPPGLEFTLKGPNDAEWYGKTPEEYQNAPIGQYTVYFNEIEGCLSPPPKSDRLEEESRITLSIELACEGVEHLQQSKDKEKSLTHVSITVGGEVITFTDAPISAWYAAYVSKVVKAGILSGYKSARGVLTGEYGPGNNVTIAELAKVAHKIAGIDETGFHDAPKNTRARGTWFTQYFASAEWHHWKVYADPRLDPGRNATRAEVVATLLQALNVSRVWPTGNRFTDVAWDAKFAASVETAALDGLVSGTTDRNGNETGKFEPNRPINRAELAKILAVAIDLYIEDSLEITGEKN